MRILYGFLTSLSHAFLWIAQFFSKKIKLFVTGRQGVFDQLQSSINSTDKIVWFHCASLGEFEQGLPIMEAVKKLLPMHKILVTFFSPSGYEIKKNTPVAHTVSYLPLDTISNAKKFISIVHPSLAIFVKYEFWPNYLFQLEQHNVPTLLVSGIFRKDQAFFKSYGGFMRKALRSFDHFFIQDQTSAGFLKELNLHNVTISGDTRFDRVAHQIEQDNSLGVIGMFKGDSLCVVCGSTWPEDETVLLDFINASSPEVSFIVAPHKIDSSKIAEFREKLTIKSILYSEVVEAKNAVREQELTSARLFVIDTIGLLSKIYSYAEIAYVGGAVGNTGLHNILEPATFGVPIVIGTHYEKFPEAKRLRQLAGLFTVGDSEECSKILEKLVADKNFRRQTGLICEHFVNNHTGATRTILNHIEKLNGDGLI